MFELAVIAANRKVFRSTGEFLLEINCRTLLAEVFEITPAVGRRVGVVEIGQSTNGNACGWQGFKVGVAIEGAIWTLAATLAFFFTLRTVVVDMSTAWSSLWLVIRYGFHLFSAQAEAYSKLRTEELRGGPR